MRATIAALVRAIRPHDALEQEHRAAALAWIDGGAPLCRTRTPDVPAQHLVSYFVVVDAARGMLLLVDHRKASLWLPPGGHVEPDEHPATTVQREAAEELRLDAAFRWAAPLFVTVTQTVGAVARHTDVSLWYVLRGDASQPLWFDEAEFHSVRWFACDAVPWARADPHLRRFVAKLAAMLVGF